MLLDSFNKFPSIEKVILFGSRAMGNYKNGSDIDIAIFGNEVDFNMITGLSTKLNEEIPIPYFVDVVQFDTIKSKALKDHIINQGIVIYSLKK